MLGIISMAGNALRSFGSIHPAIKWGIVAIVGLLAVELLAKEGISLYVAMSTAPAQIQQARGAAAAAKVQEDLAGQTLPDVDPSTISPRVVGIAPPRPDAAPK